MTEAIAKVACGWEVRIEKEMTILLPGTGLKHTMLHLLQHPDGSLYMNTHALGLYKSADDGATWTRIPLAFPDAGPNQDPGGFGIGQDGRLWVVHQSLHDGDEKHKNWQDLFVSSSDDSGRTWKTTAIDWENLAPGAPDVPYTQVCCAEAYVNFIERPDGMLMFSVDLRYDDWDDYQQEDQSRPGIRDVMIRSTDGGETWGDPTLVQQHATETDYAVDPTEPDHILAMTRKQRKLLRGEEQATVEKEAGCTIPGFAYPWKGGLLIESSDGGRSFREATGGYTGFYAHRGTILWTERNVVVVTHASEPGLVARISLDGGKTWLDDTETGTGRMNQSREFDLVPTPPGFSFTTPTVELSPNHFLTVFCSRATEKYSCGIYALVWSLERTALEDASTAAEPRPVDIEDQKQLFIDDTIIESLDGVSKQLNQPVKYAGNPVFRKVPADASRWDADMRLCFSSIIFDEAEQLFKMWYGLWVPTTPDHEGLLAYATSKDGITWHKPSLGLVHLRSTIDNNLVMENAGISAGVFKDPRETDPVRRYKMLNVVGNMRVYAAFSADGINWVRYKQGLPVIFYPPGNDTHVAPYWDEQLGKYVAIIRDRSGKIADVRPGLIAEKAAWQEMWGAHHRDPEEASIRRVGQVESDDFIYWTPMRTVLEADAEDPLHQGNFYNMEVIQYEGLRVGLMTVFYCDQGRPRGRVQLTYSRDGLNWERGGNREVFIPVSEDPEDFDWGIIYPLQGPLVVGDEIWIYYTGIGPDHNQKLPPGINELKSGIALAKLRLDGFVSVDAGAGEGTLSTKRFTFRGEKLVINADAGSGRVDVEIQDGNGNSVEGFGRDDCDPLKDDAIRHTLTWKGRGDLKRLAGKVIKLRFHLANAKLYSFGFRVVEKTI